MDEEHKTREKTANQNQYATSLTLPDTNTGSKM